MQTTETLGKYEIRRTLGRGAMGIVYEGWDPKIRRQVAIKTVRIPDTSDAELREEFARFEREAQAAGGLDHPNIVSVYDFGETLDVAYIVMEYVAGPSLKSLLEKHGRLALPEMMRVMQGLLDGLQYSHERGVVHRDIKPANIMLTSEDRITACAKIADFGIARIESSSMTQAGTIMGTPAYMSPEQLVGQQVDARTDVYAAGVLLYQLLTGERPFEGGLSAIMHKALNTEPPAPSQISVTLPTSFDDVVRKAMAKRPSDRYASAAAFASALRDANSGSAAEPTIIAPRPHMTLPAQRMQPPDATARGRPRSHLPLVLGGVALVMAMASGEVFWGLRPASVPAPSPSLAPLPSPSLKSPPLTPAPEEARLPVPVLPAAPNAPTGLTDTSPLDAAPVVTPPVSMPAASPVASPFVAAPPLPVAGLPQRPAASVLPPDPGPLIRGLLARILDAQPCAMVDGNVHNGADVVLTGLASAAAQDELRRLTADIPGIATIDWRVTTADTRYCAVLEILQSIGPGSASGEPRLNLSLADDRTALHDGDRIRPRVVTPDFGGFITLDYITNDSSATHLYPQMADPKHRIAADPTVHRQPGEILSLGEPSVGHPAWEVGEPYGTDLIIAIASSQGLFTVPRPGNAESAAGYLRDLTAAVDAAKRAGVRLSGMALPVRVTPK